MTIRKLIPMTFVALLAGVVAAQAADLRPRGPVYKAAPMMAPLWSWSGLYLGASLGGRWAMADATSTAPAAGATASANYNSATVRAGGYVGYNVQLAPAWLVGIEGDLAWGDGSATVAFIPGSLLVGSSSFRHTWDGSIRGRLGFLVSPTMLAYLTGGVAWQGVETSATVTGVGTGTAGTTLQGWTIGGGVEAALWGNWLARAEYRYADYGSFTQSVTVGGVTGTSTGSLRTHTGLVGIAYKF